jgi:hypothetical protein
MSSNQNTNNDLKSLSVGGNQRYVKIVSLMEGLHEKGMYLITERPSIIKNEYFIQLEGEINDLYWDLYEEHNDDQGNINKAALLEVLVDIEKNILPPVAEWADYAKHHPEGPRSQSLFKTNKLIGRLLVELKNRL